MAEQVAQLRVGTWERLLVAIRDAASTADPDDVKALAEAFELLMRHCPPEPDGQRPVPEDGQTAALSHSGQ